LSFWDEKVRYTLDVSSFYGVSFFYSTPWHQFGPRKDVWPAVKKLTFSPDSENTLRRLLTADPEVRCTESLSGIEWWILEGFWKPLRAAGVLPNDMGDMVRTLISGSESVITGFKEGSRVELHRFEHILTHKSLTRLFRKFRGDVCQLTLIHVQKCQMGWVASKVYTFHIQFGLDTVAIAAVSQRDVVSTSATWSQNQFLCDYYCFSVTPSSLN
jgi:hypothetical protein